MQGSFFRTANTSNNALNNTSLNAFFVGAMIILARDPPPWPPLAKVQGHPTFFLASAPAAIVFATSPLSHRAHFDVVVCCMETDRLPALN